MAENEPGVLERVRRGHEAQVLDVLHEHGALSRAALGELTTLSRSTLHDIVADLQRRGAIVVRPQPRRPRRPGRPPELVTLNPGAGHSIGIDFGHRRVNVVVADAAQEVVAEATHAYARFTEWEHRIELACDLIEQTSTDLGPLRAIGVGLTGSVDAERTELVTNRLTTRWPARVAIDNNTRLAALAETLWGAGAGSGDVVYVRLSHGVGGGIVIGGRLLRGARGTAGEIGHIPVDPQGPRCRCGGRGCVETYASIPAVLEATGRPDITDALSRFAAGDPAVAAAVTRGGRALGQALAGIWNTVGPSRIIVGGELADAMIPAAEAAMRDQLPAEFHDGVTLDRAQLGDYAGALGGVVLAAQETPLLLGYPLAESKAKA